MKKMYFLASICLQFSPRSHMCKSQNLCLSYNILLHVRLQDGRNWYRAILLLKLLEDGNNCTRHCHCRAIQRVCYATRRFLVLSRVRIGWYISNIETSSLVVGAI